MGYTARAVAEGVRERLRASFWFVPGVVTTAAAGAAIALVVWQAAVDPAIEGVVPWLFRGEADSARTVMGTVAGSMATVAGTVFSVTVVALTLAAGQFGPRVLRGFMRDRINQVVLGGFVGTFTYCLIVLRAIREGDAGVPNVAVTVGFGLALASMALLILFIHHVAESVQAGTVITGIARETLDQVRGLFHEAPGPHASAPAGPAPSGEPPVQVHAVDHGYVQVIDYGRLVEAAAETDVVVRLAVAPGDFVALGTTLALTWPAGRALDRLDRTIRASIVLDRYPSIEHDVRFGIRQIADIGVKALSPSVNDPTTATNCIDYLGAVLAHVVTRNEPSPYRTDRDGRVRLVAPGPRWDGLVRLAFGQIRMYGEHEPRVQRRILETLLRLAELAPGADRLAPLAELARDVAAGAGRQAGQPGAAEVRGLADLVLARCGASEGTTSRTDRAR